MKIDANIKIVVAISALLVLLSISISLINFSVSLNEKKTELKTRSLPLSVDNIYSEVQRNIIQPNLISSIMAHDTFVHHWLRHDEQDKQPIQDYLAAIQQKYGMFLTFLVSEKTRKYYSQKGLVEQLNPNKPENQWYFRFRDSNRQHEINLDYNDHFSNNMIMFINHKILDTDGKLLGATGIGMRMSYIDDILKHFREKYHFKVFFITHDGTVILRERHVNHLKKITDDPGLNKIKSEIFSHSKKVMAFTSNGHRYLLKSEYVPQLEAYLLVEAKLEDFTKQVRQTFYLNLAFSLAITILVILFVLMIIRRYNSKLAFYARYDSITELKNHRSFNDDFTHLLISTRKNNQPISLAFFDIDDFKQINDQLGHHIGDEVLARFGEILRTRFTKDELIARWGGEEFIIVLPSTSLPQAEQQTEALRVAIEHDEALRGLKGSAITISAGVTQCLPHETADEIFQRLDNAMYQAKDLGKNRIEKI